MTRAEQRERAVDAASRVACSGGAEECSVAEVVVVVRGEGGVCWEGVKESGRWFAAVVQIWEWRESVFTSPGGGK